VRPTRGADREEDHLVLVARVGDAFDGVSGNKRRHLGNNNYLACI